MTGLLGIRKVIWSFMHSLEPSSLPSGEKIASRSGPDQTDAPETPLTEDPNTFDISDFIPFVLHPLGTMIYVVVARRDDILRFDLPPEGRVSIFVNDLAPNVFFSDVFSDTEV
jgi:hypothetical protein